MNVHLTQYGYQNDPDGDTLTREGWGAWGNQLSQMSCALKRSTASAMNATPRCKVQIDLPTGTTMYRFWDDVIPESDSGTRCDLYQPKGFDINIPDTADISIVADDGSSPASPVG